MASGGLPAGTLTFLFTDLRDSTRLWEDRTEEMRAVVARHDQLCRSVIEANGGRVVKLLGDGVMAVFVDAPGALEAAATIQRKVSESDWPVPVAVRMGLNTGFVQPDRGDYHGPAVNRAARVASAAHPGQVLMTASTAALADGSALRELGEYELRGIGVTRLWQLRGDGLADQFPRVTTARRAAGLPVPATSFVGRENEIIRLKAFLADHRLVTITGAGGCGKTRLAIETAARLEHEYADGVRFVDLAPVTEDPQVVDAVADAAGLFSETGAEDPSAWLASALADRRVLCVLDNCEHVRDACAELVEAVLSAGGSSRVLATSREPLGVAGEQVYVVPSLDAETEAVALFLERASEARAGFEVDGGDRAVVVDVCRRLDGIALAIELAAASIAHLSPTQVLERLDDRFRLLRGTGRRVERHQTLAATLDWSHDLLLPHEQVVLRRLSVFPATFPLDAAEAVAAVDDVLEVVGALVSKSLVQTAVDGMRLRYRLPESVRLYAEGKLVAAGEAQSTHDRHRDWMIAWLEAVPFVERWFGDVDYLAAEQANIRSAIEWSIDSGDFTSVARLAGGVDWARSESWREGARICNVAREHQDELSDELLLQVVLAVWWVGPLLRERDQSSPEHSARAVSASSLSVSPFRAIALAGYGRDLSVEAIVRSDDGMRLRAIECAEEGVRLSLGYAPPWQMACRYMAVMTYLSLRDVGTADVHAAAGLAESSGEAPFRLLHAALEGYLSITRLVLGRVDDAVDLARRANERIGRTPADGTPYWFHSIYWSLPAALGERGDHDDASRAFGTFWEVMARSGMGNVNQMCAILAGVLASQRAEYEAAARLFGAVRMHIASTPADWILYLTYRDRTREALGSERARQLRDEGRAMTDDEALAVALSFT